MKKIFLLIIVAVLFLPALQMAAQDMAVSTVRFKKTEPISKKQLDETVVALEQQQRRTLTKAEKKEVLDQMIDQSLLVQAAEANPEVSTSQKEIDEAGMRLVSQQLQAMGGIPAGATITDKAQLAQILEQQGVPFDKFQLNVRKQLIVEKHITSKYKADFQEINKPSEEEIDDSYQNNISRFSVPDSVLFNQIFFRTYQISEAETKKKLKKAQNVLLRLKNTSTSFADLVSLESEDEASKARGGLIGPVMKGDPAVRQLYGETFLKKVFSMNVGDVSDVLKSNVGYHIIKITEKKAARLLAKDEPQVQRALEQIIYARKYQAKFTEVTQKEVESLRERSTINYFGEYR